MFIVLIRKIPYFTILATSSTHFRQQLSKRWFYTAVICSNYILTADTLSLLSIMGFFIHIYIFRAHMFEVCFEAGLCVAGQRNGFDELTKCTADVFDWSLRLNQRSAWSTTKQWRNTVEQCVDNTNVSISIYVFQVSTVHTCKAFIVLRLMFCNNWMKSFNKNPIGWHRSLPCTWDIRRQPTRRTKTFQ